MYIKKLTLKMIIFKKILINIYYIKNDDKKKGNVGVS